VIRAHHLITTFILAWGALAFGAVYDWAYWPLAVGSMLCGAWAVITKAQIRRVPSGALVIALTAIAVAAVVQLIPLPISLLAVVSPRASALLSELDISFAAQAVDRHAMSIAPPATMTALALYGAFATLMLGVARAVSLTGPRRIVTCIAGLGIVLAIIGIVQRPFYNGQIYGFWTPLMTGSSFGPFVNKNHFAGWMLMALPVTFGLLCASVARAIPCVGTDWRRRVLWLSSAEASQVLMLGAAAAVMVLSLVLTLSRSAILAFAASVSLTCWWAIRRLPAGWGRVVVAAYFLGLVVFGVGWVGMDNVVARFGSANPATINERLPIWQDTWRIISDFWLTGSGLNTYGVATLFYQTSVPDFHLREAHNDYLQLAAEGGLLLGLPILCAIAVLARDIRRRFSDSTGSSYWIRLGAVTGLIAVALQSTVEFSLQMPGNAALAAVLIGIALHRDPRAARGVSSEFASSPFRAQ
jgi:O-antigen ligase